MILGVPMNSLRILTICSLFFAIALLVGCSQEGPVTPNTVDNQDAVGASLQGAEEPSEVLLNGNNTVPFHMDVQNTIEIVGPPPPPIINAIFEGVGRAHPFGPFELYSTSQIDVTVEPFSQVTQYVFTFKNGDELFANSVGTGIEDPPGTVAFIGSITFSGGTGRFSDATGSGTYSGAADVVAGVGHFEIDGLIMGFGGQGH